MYTNEDLALALAAAEAGQVPSRAGLNSAERWAFDAAVVLGLIQQPTWDTCYLSYTGGRRLRDLLG